MTDPLDYFPAPTTTGAIGQGSIAQSFQIGDTPFAWQDTIISQYANSPILLEMIANLAATLDPGDDLDMFWDLVWNVQAAQGWGLDFWGKVVVVNRTLQVSPRYFGFEEGLPDFDPFNVSPFYAGGGITSSYTLQDSVYRVLIYAKALANISYGSIPGINAILQILFAGRGPCYVTDNQDMTMTYTFGFQPTPVELAIIETSNVLPRPTGVKILYEIG